MEARLGSDPTGAPLRVLAVIGSPRRDVDALGFDVAWWKKALGEIASRVMTAWLGRQLGTKE